MYVICLGNTMTVVNIATERAARVDEFGELDRQITAMRPRVARLAVLRAEIQSWYAESDAAGTFAVAGELYDVQIGAKAQQRTPMMQKLYRFLGKVKFLENCTFPVSTADKLDASAFFQTERSGPRTVTAVAREARQKAA